MLNLFIYPDVCWDPFSKVKRILGFISTKYWKGVINDKFWNIDFIHLCWLLAELDKQITVLFKGEMIAEERFPWFCKNLWLISQSWADRRTTEAKTLAANCGPSTSYLRSSWVSLFCSQVHLPLNSCLTEVLGFMYVPRVLRKHFY